ncbi:MAG: GspH/FimT family pseudopilin [Gammaproteobacteria bacterium]|nr:GspH/FimT family pseudopilin [Gammaproteobacteria bacterium]
MKQLTPSHHHGFTLTECLIVLFLLCCIAAFTVPTVHELWVRQQAESYMQQLRQALNLARVKAVSENQIVSVCPKQGNQCQYDWSHLQIAIFSGETTDFSKVWKVLPPPVNNHQLRYNRPVLQFRADGSLNGLQNGTFAYCVDGYPWHLTLSFSQAGRSQSSLEPTPCS